MQAARRFLNRRIEALSASATADPLNGLVMPPTEPSVPRNGARGHPSKARPPKPRPGQRQPMITQNRLHAVYQALASGATERQAARAAKLSLRTYFRWKAYGQHQRPGGPYAQFALCIRDGHRAAARAEREAIRAQRREQRRLQREQEIAAARRMMETFAAHDEELRRRALAELAAAPEITEERTPVPGPMCCAALQPH